MKVISLVSSGFLSCSGKSFFSTVITEVLASFLSSVSGYCEISVCDSSIDTSLIETVDWFTAAFLSPTRIIVLLSSELASSSFKSSPSMITLQFPKSAASTYLSSLSSTIPSDLITFFYFFKVSLMLYPRILMFPRSF